EPVGKASRQDDQRAQSAPHRRLREARRDDQSDLAAHVQAGFQIFEQLGLAPGLDLLAPQRDGGKPPSPPSPPRQTGPGPDQPQRRQNAVDLIVARAGARWLDRPRDLKQDFGVRRGGHFRPRRPRKIQPRSLRQQKQQRRRQKEFRKSHQPDN